MSLICDHSCTLLLSSDTYSSVHSSERVIYEMPPKPDISTPGEGEGQTSFFIERDQSFSAIFVVSDI